MSLAKFVPATEVYPNLGCFNTSNRGTGFAWALLGMYKSTGAKPDFRSLSSPQSLDPFYMCVCMCMQCHACV